MKAYKISFFVIVLLSQFGCGYFSSGTWVDDPDNWNRAFNSRKPEDVIVTHSYYWRSPHFTSEYEYFFEIAPNVKFEDQLFTENNLKLLEGYTASDVRAIKNNAPDWFLPKPIEEYTVWGYEDYPRSNFRVFIDKETGTLYLADTLL